MVFDTPGDFYFIQIIKRRKDNPTLARDMKRVAEYFVYSMKYFEEHEEQIIDEANVNNSRVYIHLHRRNSRKTALKAMMIIGDYLSSGHTNAAKTAYTSACGSQHSDPIKKWLIDVDTTDINKVKEIGDFIQNECEPNIGNSKIIVTVPTKHGFHIITRPFRKDVFTKKYPEWIIKRDSPTVLYIPD